MIVTTLPVAYKPGRPHRVMMSAYAASILAKCTGSRAFFPINMISLRGDSWGSVSKGIASYKSILEVLGYVKPGDRVLADADPAIVQFSQWHIADALKSGVCELRTEHVSSCECGKVEILSSLLNSLAETHRLKLVKKIDGQYVCAMCNNKVHSEHRQVLLYHQPALLPVPMAPAIHQKRLDSISEELGRKTYLVSRHLSTRKYGVPISDTLGLDPDFHFGLYLRYLSDIERNREVVIVVSASHMYRALRAVGVANSLGTPLRCVLVSHPMFDFASGNTLLGQKMSSIDFIDILGDPVALKLFQATMLRWGSLETSCNIGDLPLLQKTVPSLAEYANLEATVSLETVMQQLNRNHVLSVLKKVRKRKSLTNEERCLIAAMLN